VLFNMGEQYEDIKDLNDYWGKSVFDADYAGTQYDGYNYWQFLGYNLGDFVIRILYREYYADISVDFSAS
jgi:hypothetical protein